MELDKFFSQLELLDFICCLLKESPQGHHPLHPRVPFWDISDLSDSSAIRRAMVWKAYAVSMSPRDKASQKLQAWLHNRPLLL